MSIELAKWISQFSVCKKRKVGCVILENNQLIAYGVNHGLSEKCTCNPNTKNPDVIHAEQHALSKCVGKDLSNAVLYVSYPPCTKCQKLIAQHNLKEVIYEHT